MWVESGLALDEDEPRVGAKTDAVFAGVERQRDPGIVLDALEFAPEAERGGEG
jgi:hypothetical protein